jgi:23S rRNA pseudouridine1911/1915/1917 synthase
VRIAEAGGRLDRLLESSLPGFSRSQIKRLADQGRVRVNGVPAKAGHPLREGEELEVALPEPIREGGPLPEPIPLSVVYEDESLLVVEKPAGMVVHPGAGVRTGTMVNALLGRGTKLSGLGMPHRPGIVHRLDKGTSGLLVVAKTDTIHRALAADLAARRMSRRYLALVWGCPDPPRGTIRRSLARSRVDRRRIRVVPSGGREAVTRYEVAGTWSGISLVHLALDTGRTHQIRVHFKSLGHPVFGDPEYGGRKRSLPGRSREERERVRAALACLARQALHAATLGFRHPASGEPFSFTSAAPDDIQGAARALGIPPRTLGPVDTEDP